MEDLTDPSSDPAAANPDADAPRWNWRTAAVGFGAGLLNGLLGVGGGIILVPGLIMLRNLQPRAAVATSLATVLFLSSLALVVHVGLSGLYFSIGGSLLLLASGAAGTQLGSFLLNRIPQRWILFIFAAFTFFASTYLILKGLHLVGGASLAVVSPPLHSYAVIGALAGFSSGMLGVGGGGIVVMGFATFYNTPILGGIPLALAVNVANSLSGVVAHGGTRNMKWGEALRLLPAALAGIAIGIALAVVLSGSLLQILFAVFFLYMGTRLIKRGLRS